MDKYRKFTVETLALIDAMKDGPRQDQSIVIDARLFDALVRLTDAVKSGWPHHLDFVLGEAKKALEKRFSLNQEDAEESETDQAEE